MKPNRRDPAARLFAAPCRRRPGGGDLHGTEFPLLGGGSVRRAEDDALQDRLRDLPGEQLGVVPSRRRRLESAQPDPHAPRGRALPPRFAARRQDFLPRPRRPRGCDSPQRLLHEPRRVRSDVGRRERGAGPAGAPTEPPLRI